MRKLIYAINLTLDGGCDHTNGVPDDDVFEYATQLVRGADLLVFGRKTYQLMVPYWPDIAKNPSETKEDREFADTFVSKDKLFFHNHWRALKIKIRQLFAPTFETK